MANKDKINNLDDLIRNSIGGEVTEQKVSLLLAPGENYASVLYKVDFKVKKDGKIYEFNAVAKCPPPSTIAQEMCNIQVTFKAEIAWYTIVIPTLIQFQNERGVSNKIDFFQKLFGARISLDPDSNVVDKNAVILTENLKCLGYRNIDRNIGFDLSTTYTILKNLAAFHTVPLALRHHNPDVFTKNILPYLRGWDLNNADFELEFKKPIFDVYQHIPECQLLLDRIKETVDNSNIFGKREIRYPWVTAIHMDFWSNNIMVTEDKETKTLILDLQSVFFGSPAADLVFFLLTSVRHDVISRRFDDFINFYYKEFIKNLNDFNVPTDKMSFDAFLEEFNTEAKLGALAHALGHIYVIFSEEVSYDITKENFSNDDFVNSKTVVNAKHIEKFRWITFEAEKRKWI